MIHSVHFSAIPNARNQEAFALKLHKPRTHVPRARSPPREPSRRLVIHSCEPVYDTQHTSLDVLEPDAPETGTPERPLQAPCSRRGPPRARTRPAAARARHAPPPSLLARKARHPQRSGSRRPHPPTHTPHRGTGAAPAEQHRDTAARAPDPWAPLTLLGAVCGLVLSSGDFGGERISGRSSAP